MSCVSLLSRDGQGLPHAIMQTPCVYCAKDSKGCKPRLVSALIILDKTISSTI